MNRLQSPKSPIESPLGFAQSFRVHGPISTSEFAAVSTPPPRNNSLRYIQGVTDLSEGTQSQDQRKIARALDWDERCPSET